MIDAYGPAFPATASRFPDGAKMAKIHWVPKKMDTSLHDGAGHPA